MNRFRMDNTEGYSQSDLDELNKAFDVITFDSETDFPDEMRRKSYLDRIAEKLCARFDDGERGHDLIFWGNNP